MDFAGIHPQVWAAIIAAVVSLAVNGVLALWSGAKARAHEKKMLDEKAWSQYRFEARKRLYTECEPIIFQMRESSQYFLRRIPTIFTDQAEEGLRCSIVSTEDAPAWMLSNSSNIIDLFYCIYSPIALHRILSKKLTTVDISLDPATWFRYRLGQELYRSLLNDHEIAKVNPERKYNPVSPGWRKLRLENPSVYWWQGLTRGRLDRATECFIEAGPDGVQLMSFGAFEDRYNAVYEEGDLDEQKILGVAANPLYEFSLSERPIYSRILIAQLWLHRCFEEDLPANVGTLTQRPEELSAYLDDHTPNVRFGSEDQNRISLIREHQSAARAYLLEQLLCR